VNKRFALLLFVTIGATGCATIVHGRYQNVEVASQPAGAHVDVDCGDVPHDGGTTPATVKVRRGADHCVLTLSSAGYAAETVTLKKAIAGAAWANVGVGLVTGLGVGAALAPVSILGNENDNSANNGAMAGLVVGAAIPMLIDRGTGAMYKQMPERVSVTLKAP
jgi:hypothetical protein